MLTIYAKEIISYERLTAENQETFFQVSATTQQLKKESQRPLINSSCR